MEQIDRAMELVKEYAQRQGWAVWADWSMTKRSRHRAGGAGTYRVKVEVREGMVCVVVYCPPMLSEEFYSELTTPLCKVEECEAPELARVLRDTLFQWR